MLREVLAHNFVLNNYRGVINMKPKSKLSFGKPKAAPQRDEWSASKRAVPSQDEIDTLLDRLRDGLLIDKHNLDDCIMQQPPLYLEVQEAYVLAASVRDERKTYVDEVSATTADSVRRDLTTKDSKPTENQIKEHVATSKEYLDAVATYQDAKKSSDRLGVMVAAYEERGRMLSKLANLFQAGYWSSASASGAGVRDMKAHVAEAAREEMAAQRRPLFKK